MMRKISHIVVIGASFGLMAALASPSVAAPGYPVEFGKRGGSEIVLASFWGWPFPYGYTHRSYRSDRCFRHVRVHTRSGWRTKRTWVCK